MFETLKILTKSEKKQFFFLALLVFFSVFVELLSLGLILPVTSYIFTDNSVFNDYLKDIIFFENLSKNQIINILLIILTSAFLIKNLFLAYFYYYENFFLYKTTQNISVKLYKITLFKNIIDHLSKHSSEVVNNLTKETAMFGSYLSSLVLLITEIPIITGICIFLFYLEPLGFSVICTTSALLGLIYYYSTKKRLNKMGYNRMAAEQKKIQFLQEAIDGIKEIKIYNRENFFLKKFEEISQKIARVYYIYGFFNKLPRLFYEFMFVILVVVVIFYFNYQNAKSTDFIPFLSLLLVASLRILPSLNRIFGAVQQLNFTRSSRDTIFNEISNSSKAKKETHKIKFKNSIKFENISFSFDRIQKNIISKFSFELNKGDLVSILGTTGTGKSTLLNLFSGLLKPNSGEVYMDDKKIDYSKIDWFDQISYVPQTTFLFDDTILENIIFGSKHVDKERLEKCIKISQLEPLLKKLPKGLDTIVGDEGKKLSGGEKQRIGIARALYENSEILIFDEATSALDEITEMNLFESLTNHIKKEKLFIFVTHKQSLVKYSSKTIKL